MADYNRINVSGSSYSPADGVYVNTGKILNNNPIYIKEESSDYPFVLFNFEDAWSLRCISDYSKDDILGAEGDELLGMLTMYPVMDRSESPAALNGALWDNQKMTVLPISTEDDSTGSKITYIVSGAGTKYVDGEYVEVPEVIKNNKSVYALETIKDGSPTLLVIYFTEGSENPAYLLESPNEITTIQSLIVSTEANGILIDTFWEQGPHLYVCESHDLVSSPWHGISGNDPAPTVTLKSVSTDQPETPTKPEIPEGTNAYVVSNAGTKWLNGIYINTTRIIGDYNAYAREVTDESGTKYLSVILHRRDNGWVILTTTDVVTIEAFKDEADANEVTIFSDSGKYWYFKSLINNNEDDILGQWTIPSNHYGESPAPVVTLYGGTGTDEPDEPTVTYPSELYVSNSETSENGVYVNTGWMLNGFPVYCYQRETSYFLLFSRIINSKKYYYICSDGGFSNWNEVESAFGNSDNPEFGLFLESLTTNGNGIFMKTEDYLGEYNKMSDGNPGAIVSLDEISSDQDESENENINYQELKFYVGNVPEFVGIEFWFAHDDGSEITYAYSINDYDFLSIRVYPSTKEIVVEKTISDVYTKVAKFSYDNFTNFNTTLIEKDPSVDNPIISLTPIEVPEPDPEPEPPTLDQPNNNSFNYEIINAEHTYVNGIYKPTGIIYNDSEIYIGITLDDSNVECCVILWRQNSTRWEISFYGYADTFENEVNKLKIYNDEGSLGFFLTDVITRMYYSNTESIEGTWTKYSTSETSTLSVKKISDNIEPSKPTPDQPETTTPVRYMMAFRF